MSQQHHKVFRLKVDYTLPEEEPVAPVQDRMSRLIHHSLIRVLDDLFSELGNTELYINIDQLVLDVGKINIERLEKELPERLEERLRAQLPLLIRQNMPVSLTKRSAAKTKPLLLEILIFYLKKGAYPWWIPDSVSRDSLELFRTLFQDKRSQLEEALPEMLGTEWSRKRIVIHFKNRDLEKIVQLLEPGNSKTIIDYNNALEVQHEKAPIIPMQQNDFRNLRWELILEYLHESRGTEFNQKSFLKQILKGLALKFNMTFSELLLSLKDVVKKISMYYNQVHSLLRNILELSGEIEKNEEENKSNKNRDLLKGFQGEEKEIAEAYLAIILDGERYENIKVHNTSVWLKLIEKLWISDASLAILFIKKFIAKGKSHQHYLIQLPGYIKRSLLSDMHAEIAQELWSLRKDLTLILKENKDKALRMPGIEKIIDRIYFQLLVLPGSVADARLVTYRILSNVTLKKQTDFYVFIKTLFKAVQYFENSFQLQSGLGEHLRNIIGAYRGLSATETIVQETENWLFDTQKESLSDYLQRLAAAVKSKEALVLQPAFFKSYPLWLSELIRRWSDDQQQSLFKKIWPGISDFAKIWMEDLHILLTLLYEEQQIKRFPATLRVQQIVWSVFFESGALGPSRLVLIRESLSKLASEVLVRESRFFELVFRMSQNKNISLGLQQNLPGLLQKAMQSKLFISSSATGQNRLIRKSEKQSLSGLEIINTYFEKEMLPGYMTLSEFRMLVDKVQKEHKIAFRFLILKLIKAELTRQRVALFFSNQKNAELVDLLFPQAGAIALLFFTKHQETQANTQQIQWKIYWAIVLEIIADAYQNGFDFNSFIKKLLAKSILQFSVQPQVLINQLLQTKSDGGATLVPLLQVLLSSEYHLYTLAHKLENSDLKRPAEKQLLEDFSNLKIPELAGWAMQFLHGLEVNSNIQNSQRLMTFSRFIIDLSIKKRKEFWEAFTDQATLQLFRQLLSNKEVDQIIDVAVLLRQVEIENQKSRTGFFPFELSDLLLHAILNDRGSFSNQKNFIVKLLKDWARAHNLIYSDLLETLWPLIWKLSPAFKHHHSLSIFSEILQEEISADRLEVLYLPHEAGEEDKERTKETYKKLWDMDEKQIEMDDIWLIQNAGLAILWPYFKVLFERAELMEEGEFTDDKSRQQAILLLEYLVTGDKVNPEEHVLVFNKILCGVPIAAPIVETLEIDKTLEELCDGLLHAVIQHWSVLGDTSITAFRESFLQRDGQLGQIEDYWQLEVETRAFDILLRQIPWGFNPVNLSWVNKTVKINWEK